MKIILYGLGKGFKECFKQLKQIDSVVAVSDSFATIKNFRGIPFILPYNIKKVDCDYVVVTLMDKRKSIILASHLAKTLGIDINKIIPYFCCVESQLYKLKTKNRNLGKYEYLALGNSHAFHGILESVFEGRLINLSVSSQDLFYISCVFERVVEKLKNIHTLILDLYDYTYFNVDISKGKGISDYWLSGGVLEEHHFYENKNYMEYCGMKDFLRRKLLIDTTYNEVVEQIFVNDLNPYIEDPEECWSHIDPEPLLLSNVLRYATKNRYESTICENEKIFDNLLFECKRRDIKVICTLLPRYILQDEILDTFYSGWKNFFENIMKENIKKYNIYFWNYKRDSRIAENPRFYFDSGHLNTVGGVAMTSILLEDLRIWGF